MRRDKYDKYPEDMREYLSTYGWHFSKKMAEWAISKMRDRNEEKVKPKDKEALHQQLKSAGIDTDKIVGYDAVYVEAMARSDFFGSSITTDAHILKFVGDYLNDKDGYEDIAFNRFYADTIGKGIYIDWEMMI